MVVVYVSVCRTGLHLAEQSLFITISRILWAFDIKRAVDPKTGEEVDPPFSLEEAYIDGELSAPVFSPSPVFPFFENESGVEKSHFLTRNICLFTHAPTGRLCHLAQVISGRLQGSQRGATQAYRTSVL
jgi:hypothetical protein